MDKVALLNRLEKMFWLPKDWDGCGTIPITRKVYDVSRDMIEMINTNPNIKIFVGVEVEGSLYVEAHKGACRIELTVNPDGIIHYTELRDACVMARGSLVLNYESINSILA